MAGNAWKYSGVLDDYDLAFLQRDFITIKQGVEYYGFSERHEDLCNRFRLRWLAISTSFLDEVSYHWLRLEPIAR